MPCNHNHIHDETCTKPLVHYHLHTSFSNLDGCGKIKDYIKLAKQYNHPGIAITDHGNPAGLMDFYRQVKAEGLKPVLGEEFYLTNNLEEKIPSSQRELINKDKHQTILIKDENGYKNFCKLNYLAFTEGYYYKPRISFDMLFENNKGLIITTGCMASIFNQFIKHNEFQQAEEWFKKFVNKFGDDFYGEIQFNEILKQRGFDIDQKEINDFIIRMCNKYDIPILITGDVHYAHKGDHELQNIVISNMRDGQANFIHAQHLYYHSSEDYYELNKKFDYNYDDKFIQQCFDNSIKLLDKVNFDFKFGEVNFPKYQDPVYINKSNDELLRLLAIKGLKEKIKARKEKGEKFSNELIDQYQQRLDYEIEIIKQKQIVDYFLIVQDVVNWAKSNGIMVGCARGSAAGALVSYATNITEIDPLQFGLLFERFQNPERISLPDIDMDFEQGSRESIRHYLEEKYGKECVAGVVTHMLYHPKSALQDAARGLGKDTSFTSTLMQEITSLPDLEEAKDLEKYFENIVEKNITDSVANWIATNQDVIHWANKLMGQCKNMGTHAGGILITPGPIYDYIPVTRAAKEVVTAFKEADGSSKDLSDLGLLKLDILGLKTLNVIHSCIKQIKNDLNKDITNDIRFIDLNDDSLYKLFSKGNNIGIFQMDKLGMDIINSVKPDSFEDIVAINAINRPGPKETFGFLYGRWKKLFKEGKEPNIEEEKTYPRLDFMQEITRESYGTLIYQEQFMLMVQKAAGFTLGEADNFRRAIAWKEDHPKYHTVKKYFEQLQSKMLEKGYSQKDVEYFVEYSRNFMGYSFNKSHAVSYAYIAMQTLYLKQYYPVYFFCNMFNIEDQEEYQKIVSDAIAHNIEILPPSLRYSDYLCKVENGKIRLGFQMLKGFGESAWEELKNMNIQPDESLASILSRPFKKVNSKAFSALIDAGAFDEFNVERTKIETIRELYKDPKIEKWFTYKNEKWRLSIDKMPESLKVISETILFSIIDEIKDKPEPWKELVTQLIPSIKGKILDEETKASKAEEILGFNLLYANKISRLMQEVEKYPELNLCSLTQRQNEEDLCYWFVLNVTKAKTQHGKTYLKLTISDKNTSIKANCWANIKLEKGKAYISNIQQNKYGYSIVNNSFLTEIEL